MLLPAITSSKASVEAEKARVAQHAHEPQFPKNSPSIYSITENFSHLKGVKIGIMGCIVNGPGEMADADYGYVGIGKDKISLYRGQNVVKRSVKAMEAVDQLIELIKEDGKWLEPSNSVMLVNQ